MEVVLMTSNNPNKASELRGEARRVLTVSTDGGVVCSWGRGEDGQLGHGDANNRDLPTTVSALGNCEISSITCRADHTTARLDSTRTVYSWGCLPLNRGDFGRLGHGNSNNLLLPHPIRVLQGLEIKHMACDDSHCLAISTQGEVYTSISSLKSCQKCCGELFQL